MFTGIIDHCGVIKTIDNSNGSCRLLISSQFDGLVLGESISVNGICLTVTSIQGHSFTCDLSPETLNVTTAKNFKENQSVNLERALQLSSRLGGHFVSGHVDQVARVKSITKKNEFTEIMFFGINEDNKRLITKKGSISINGVSLTLNDVKEDTFGVMLIPHTLEVTNLSELIEGSEVNIEFDMIARIIVDQYMRYQQ